MKTEYLQEVKNLLSENYQPVLSLFEENEYTVRKTLADIYRDVCNIIPGEWIYESDVYEILKELGFKSFLITLEEIKNKKGEVIRPQQNVFAYLLDKKTAAI